MVGWSIDSRQAAALVTNALGMALHNRETAVDTVIHSDHGVQSRINESSNPVLMAAAARAETREKCP